jgi:hypothetical protein
MDLRKILVTGLNVDIAQDVAAKAAADPEILKELLRASFSTELPLAAKAAWTLRHLSLIAPKVLFRHRSKIAQHLNGPTDGIKRDLLFTLCELPLCEEDDLGIVVDHCMKWLADAKIALAVKYNCLKMFEKVCTAWPELGEEVALILEDEKTRHSSGFRKAAEHLIGTINKG